MDDGPDGANCATAEIFVDAIARLELDPTTSYATRCEGIRCFVHPHGREGSPFTHEFFPHDVPANEAMCIARAITGGAPHLIFPMGERVHGDTAEYVAAGYTHTTGWTVMTRTLGPTLVQPGDARVRAITDAETESRVLHGVLPDGGTGHPLRGGLVGDSTIRQCWVEDKGDPAAFGRIVILGTAAYLGDVATAPAYRRRGHAAAITRRLLNDAAKAGATTCVLVSTAMALGLYRSFGFKELMPVLEFRSPGVGGN